MVQSLRGSPRWCSVSQVDGVLGITSPCQLCGSVGEEFRKRTIASAPSSCLDARHFSSSPYATGAFQLLPQCWSSEGVSRSKSMCRFFKRNCLGPQKFLPPTQSSSGFCSQKLWELIFLALGPWAAGHGMGLGLLAPEISLLNFYPPHLDVGPACSASLPLLSVWMDVDSLIP